ncbi:MAG: TldD/PmbA family protein [Deltaproteobacteria bacterium]|nr:TldD/PmbA family protein [Deltaproteobacteria bacterium]
MSKELLEGVAERLLAAAKRHGATAADVVVAESDALEVAVRLGGVEKLKQARQKHLGLRAFIGDRSAVTSSSDFSPEALEKLAADSCKLAAILAADPFSGLPETEDLATQIPELDLYDAGVAALSAEEAIDMARQGEQAALDADARITNSEGAECNASTARVLYASSGGFTGSYSSSGISLSVVPVASHNGAMQRDYWYSSQRHLADLENPAQIGKKAAQRALRRLDARQVRTCEVPVVFDPQMAAGLLHHLASAISGYALYKGTSFLVGKLGERIAPGFVTVVDDGTLPGRHGSKPFDGEGLATRRTMVIENGVLKSYLFDTYSARKLGSRSTGNASRSVGSSPHVSPTNFVLQAGSAAPEEIIGSVKAGLYVTELIGHGINGTTGDYSRGAVGLWIENGELAYPVEEITIAGNLLQMYAAIEMIGNDLDYRSSVIAPTVKIGKMTVAGN